ncbi:hypothetical protein L1887_32734 [Cichorium endivia]|nr:hypothetical protein L1887_32734 [Cichorium endivia]
MLSESSLETPHTATTAPTVAIVMALTAPIEPLSLFSLRFGSMDLSLHTSQKNEKIADFGVARIEVQTEGMSIEIGTYRWMALGWDQFETNATLFGVKSTFNEELYTTKLDRVVMMKDIWDSENNETFGNITDSIINNPLTDLKSGSQPPSSFPSLVFVQVVNLVLSRILVEGQSSQTSTSNDFYPSNYLDNESRIQDQSNQQKAGKQMVD